jgi:hypothetical protein
MSEGVTVEEKAALMAEWWRNNLTEVVVDE